VLGHLASSAQYLLIRVTQKRAKKTTRFSDEAGAICKMKIVWRRKETAMRNLKDLVFSFFSALGYVALAADGDYLVSPANE
jgi:hypothetical protein